MELEELRKVWKRQETRGETEYSRPELLMLINNRVIAMEREIRARDRREILGCILVIASFGTLFFSTTSIWQQLGCMVLVMAGFVVWYKLKAAQPVAQEQEASYNRPMKEHLRLELERAGRQRRLLNSVGSWYVLPFTLGLLLFTAGFDSSLGFKAGYAAFVLILGGWVWKMNRDTARARFDPLIRELSEAIEFVEEEGA